MARLALFVLYGASCGVCSYGLGMAFGTAAQLIAIPIFVVGGIILGWTTA